MQGIFGTYKRIVDILQQDQPRQVLVEGKLNYRRFSNTTEVDEFIDTLNEMINAQSLAEYSRKTDAEFKTKLSPKLVTLKKAMKDFFGEYLSPEDLKGS